MYLQGETFYHIIDDEKLEFTVLENIMLKDEEYLITEDITGVKAVFFYDENEDEIVYIDDPMTSNKILDYWKDEYLCSSNIGDWDDDEYYEREDSFNRDILFDIDYDEDREYY